MNREKHEAVYRYGPDYEETVHLRDGTKVVLRPIKPSDKEKLLEGFRRLSPESRYKRFLTSKNELTDSELRYLTEVDGIDHFALVALIRRLFGEEEGIGVGRFVRLANEPDTAEPAIAVVDDYQGRGLGTILLRNLFDAAWERGIRRFRCRMLLENTQVRDLFGEVATDVHVEEIEDGAIEVIMPVEAPVPQEERRLRPPIRQVLSGIARGIISVIPMQSGSLKEGVETELKWLKSDLKRLADDIRDKVDEAGKDATDAWKKLEAERQRFSKQVEQAAEESWKDLRQVGAELKRRLQSLRDELKPSGEPSEQSPGRSTNG